MRLALLGDPVEHSRSPAMHTAALAAAGIAGTYEARRADVAVMEESADDVRRGELHGANITMPHKHLAYRLADVVDPEAERAGSVNTWFAHPSGVGGTSTDIPGLRRVCASRSFPDGPALVLGAGGAAAAALVALVGRPLVMAARSAERAVDVIARCDIDASIVPWGEPVEGALVVNCTPLGMKGEELPPSVLESAGGLLDMAYGPRPTPAVETARELGIPVADGIDLLVAQAEESFLLWTGVEPAAGVMAEAARKA